MISLNNFSDIDLETDIAVITLDDNLLHTYLAKVSWERDNSTATGSAKLVIPYSTDIEKYWSTYNGIVVVHANLNTSSNTNNTFSLSSQEKKIHKKKNDNKIHIQNNQYNYSFIGKIHRFQQIGKTFVVYLEDLGWKFTQKVPDEFRKTYIAGQTLDNAFQAICELMGIEFAYSIEDLSQYNFSSDGYSIEKNGDVIEDIPSIFKTLQGDEEIKKTEDEYIGESLNNVDFESPELILQQTNNNQLTSSTNNNLTTVSNEQNPKLEEFEKEFDEKIKDLFKGNTLYNSNTSDPILNYDWVTVSPVSTSNDTQSTTNSLTTGDTNTQNQTSYNQHSSKTTSNTQNKTNTKNNIQGKTKAGSYYLTQDYINSLSMAEAKNKYEYGKAHEPYYTRATMEKLWYRMMFGTKFY